MKTYRAYTKEPNKEITTVLIQAKTEQSAMNKLKRINKQIEIVYIEEVDYYEPEI